MKYSESPSPNYFFFPPPFGRGREEIWKLMNKRMSSIYPLARQNIDIHSAKRSCQSPVQFLQPSFERRCKFWSSVYFSSTNESGSTKCGSPKRGDLGAN